MSTPGRAEWIAMVQFFEFAVFARRARFGDRLAPLHLFHKKLGRHARIAFLADIVAGQAEQILGANQRLLQALVGLIDTRCPLQGQAAFGLSRMNEPVRMYLRLDLPETLVQRQGIDAKNRDQTEQGEIIGVEIDFIASRIHVNALSAKVHRFYSSNFEFKR